MAVPIHITIKQKEAKTLTFTIKDEDGDPVSVDTATLTFQAADADGTKIVDIADEDFDKTLASSGIVTCVLTTTHTAIAGDLTGDLKIYFTATSIDKSANIIIHILSAITDSFSE